ncbi:cystathionine gamma-synthase [Actinomycetospora sp. NBRC 106375]|uniref:cystathionine gamma-synthase n=1 Tax=Actinomycetospora sp. NBRC 106375 TaxID=3032207 RepID=UPI002554F070|nr:cystathionine gamma-synthase [Actinomycetospora sp. NBRC 106375]
MPRVDGVNGFSTRALHDGQEPDPTTGSVVVPIHATSTFAQDGVGGLRSGYEYARTGNPTRTALETTLASLEGARHARAFASGMAAEDALLRGVLRPGDHVLIPMDAYGGTYRLISTVYCDWGVEYTAVDTADLDAVRAAIRPNTKVLWCETPTNPLLGIADIAGLATLAREHDLMLVVDNTFASPYLQTPIGLGAHAVVHSTTKYLGGHSDVVGGALVTDDDELHETLGKMQNGMGAVPGPFDCFLTQRGLKTLAVRMERHSDNAERVADVLAAHPAITSVLYPGRADHPGHEVAAKQMRRFGGMVSVRVAGGEQAARDLCAATRVFTLAESLGGVESLIEHPGAMTHASAAGSLLEVPADLVRLSVGLEDADDLVDDLRQALASLG